MVKPYYDHAGIQIWHGDCREILPGLPLVDLVLTDPPYNAGIDYGEHDDSKTWEHHVLWLKDIIVLCENVSSGLVLVFQSVRGLIEMCAIHPPRWVSVWNKPMAFSHRVGGSPWLPHWEPCLAYGKAWGEGGARTILFSGRRIYF